MQTYWEWAASKGISYRTTYSEKQYYDEVVAAEETAPPYVEPPPIPPKVTVVNKSQQVVTAGIRPRAAYSRVVSMVAIAKFQGNPAIAVSEAIGNSFIVLDVWVRVLWSLVDEPPELYFRLTTGVGKAPDIATVRDWEPVIPLIWEGQQSPWVANEALAEFHWSLDKRYGAEGRRLALWTNMFAGGVGIASVFASYRISEG